MPLILPIKFLLDRKTYRSWFSFLALFFAFSFIARPQSKGIYSILFPHDFSKEVSDDVVNLLNQSTSAKWITASNEKNVKEGIVLKFSNNSLFKTKESYHMLSNGSSLLIISSSSTEGLVFGIYKHLRSLGFKFYLPDDLYTITPSIKNPFGAKRDIIDQPFVSIRSFFGTGGLGSGNSDPDRSVEKSWNFWKIRNGFGAAYELAGHRGENFILENKEQLLKNPQWLVSPITNNAHTDQSIKLNYANKEALNFFTDWSIHPFTNNTFQLPPPNHTQFVSIEPADGGGYINELPANAKKNLPSVSDQVFGAANAAALKLDKLFPKHPNIGVNLYAYSSHAEPPSFPLHPRVFVQLVPYQFQNVAFGPSFIKMWATKAKRFGIYDYFKYADAQYDLPGGITLKEVMQRLIFSTKNGSEGTNFETSYSKFSTGIPLWVIARYLADGDSNWEKNLNFLTNDLFPNTGNSIIELFDLFYNKPSFSSNSLSHATKLIEQASKKSDNTIVQKRLSELKQYLFFIHLVYRSRDEKLGSFQQRLVPVAEYAWKIYESKIVHSYRIMQLVSYAFLNSDQSDPAYGSYRKLHVDWFPETDKNISAWGKISQTIPASNTESEFKQLQQRYNKSVPSHTYSFKEVKEAVIKIYKPKKEFIIGGGYTTRGYFGIYTDKATVVKIKYTNTHPADLPKVTISGIDKNYSTPIAFAINKTTGELKFTVPAGETTLFIHSSDNTSYRFHVAIDDGYVFFDGSPRSLMAFYKKFDDPIERNTYDPSYYPSYIFFPAGINTLDYRVQVNSLQIISPTGRKTESKLLQSEYGGFEIRQLNFPKEESGKIWKAIISGNYNYSFLTIPDRYFLLEPK